MQPSKTLITVSWILRLLAALILLQTLAFKFTGAKESVYIFSTLGLEPWGRIGSGVTELIAAILLLVPRTVVFGATLSLGVISVAILSHLTKLGITLPQVDDHGELFALACAVLLCSVSILWIHKADVLALLPLSGTVTGPRA
jgi:putative oxidoreductase